MKKSIFSVLAAMALMLVCLTGCGAGGDGGSLLGGKSVDEAVVGVWYGPNSDPVLNIAADGTGKVTYQGSEYAGEYTAAGGQFAVASEGCSFGGAYTVAGNLMTVSIPSGDKTYEVIFQREVYKADTSLVYVVEEVYYEIVLTETGGGTIGEKQMPPTPEGSTLEVLEIYHVVEVFPHPETSGETSEAEPQPELHIHKRPPEDVFGGVKSTATTTKPAEKEKKPIPETAIPETVTPPAGEKDGEVNVPDGNGGVKPATSLESGGSIVGTWTSAPQNVDIYFFGYETSTDTVVTYIFNEDGTGTVSTMGIFTFPLTYTYENNMLTISISAFGQTSGGTGYAEVVGDVFYVTDMEDGEMVALGRG